MKSMTKTSLLSSIVLLASLCLTSCGNKITTGEQGLIHETKFNSSYINLTNDELKAYGFEWGDSCNVSFSNGKKMEDIPYYDGYYTRSDNPLICGYQGYPDVQITINNCSDFWDQYDLKETDKVTITLNEKGKYLDVQDAFSMHYENERDLFPSNAVFANYREIATGNIKPGRLYRGASPFNNNYNRAPYVNKLLEENQVKFILDLSDSKEDIETYAMIYPGSEGCYASKQTRVFLNMGSNFRGDLLGDSEEEEDGLPEDNNLIGLGLTVSAFRASLVEGLTTMIECEGPYYVHCVEGKDRTGFVSMLLEALCGASYSEMKVDYMITYANYFNITFADSKYEAVSHLRYDEFMEFLSGQAEGLENIDFAPYAKKYLIESGMGEEDIATLIDRLCK